MPILQTLFFGKFWVTLLVVMLMLLDCVPGNYVGAAYISPSLFLIPIFYVAVFSEQEMSPVIVLLLGLFKDLLSATPLGFWGLLLCGFYGLAFLQRQFVQSASGQGAVQNPLQRDWAVFSILTAGVFFVGYLLGLFLDVPAAQFTTYLGSFILTALLYPMILFVFRFAFLRGI